MIRLNTTSAGRSLLQGANATVATQASSQGANFSASATASNQARRFPESAAQYFTAAKWYYQSAVQWARLTDYDKANDAARLAAAASNGAATAAAAGGGAGKTTPLCFVAISYFPTSGFAS